MKGILAFLVQSLEPCINYPSSSPTLHLRGSGSVMVLFKGSSLFGCCLLLSTLAFVYECLSAIWLCFVQWTEVEDYTYIKIFMLLLWSHFYNHGSEMARFWASPVVLSQKSQAFLLRSYTTHWSHCWSPLGWRIHFHTRHVFKSMGTVKHWKLPTRKPDDATMYSSPEWRSTKIVGKGLSIIPASAFILHE